LGVAWSLSKAQLTPNVFLGLAVGFGLFDLVFYTSLTVTGVDVVGEFGWPAVLVGNVLATLSMVSYLWIKHPKLRQTLAAEAMDKTA
jgi:hypothetical protein